MTEDEFKDAVVTAERMRKTSHHLQPMTPSETEALADVVEVMALAIVNLQDRLATVERERDIAKANAETNDVLNGRYWVP
jgi:hypothetical protein